MSNKYGLISRGGAGATLRESEESRVKFFKYVREHCESSSDDSLFQLRKLREALLPLPITSFTRDVYVYSVKEIVGTCDVGKQLILGSLLETLLRDIHTACQLETDDLRLVVRLRVYQLALSAENDPGKLSLAYKIAFRYQSSYSTLLFTTLRAIVAGNYVTFQQCIALEPDQIVQSYLHKNDTTIAELATNCIQKAYRSPPKALLQRWSK